MKKKIKLIILLLLPGVLAINKVDAQTINGTKLDGSRQSNILTAVPFLLITPQARAAAMGEAGVAVDGDANSAILNSAAFAFLPKGAIGVSMSYSPWLKNLVPDVSLSYLSGYYRIDDRNTLAASLRYFSLGNVQFTDKNSQDMGVLNPNEFAVDFSYARSFGQGFALGGSLRFIRSNLFEGQLASGARAEGGKAVAVDISGLYKKDVLLFGKLMIWSAGINITNLGKKIDYNADAKSYFLPANFKIGTAATLLPDDDNRFIIALDLNKLMVPTQPVYNQNGEIIKGRDPDRSVTSGIFGSFSDAPDGLGEEVKEIGISTGIEYSYRDRFALRSGYNYQHPEKGNNSYLTLGAGFKYTILSIDFAYLVGSNNSPLANTLRFGLQVRFDRKKNGS